MALLAEIAPPLNLPQLHKSFWEIAHAPYVVLAPRHLGNTRHTPSCRCPASPSTSAPGEHTLPAPRQTRICSCIWPSYSRHNEQRGAYVGEAILFTTAELYPDLFTLQRHLAEEEQEKISLEDLALIADHLTEDERATFLKFVRRETQSNAITTSSSHDSHTISTPSSHSCSAIKVVEGTSCTVHNIGRYFISGDISSIPDFWRRLCHPPMPFHPFYDEWFLTQIEKHELQDETEVLSQHAIEPLPPIPLKSDFIEYVAREPKRAFRWLDVRSC